MSAKGPYFIWDSNVKKYFCADGNWRTGNQIRGNVEYLCKFATSSAAKTQSQMFEINTVQPLCSSTIRKHLCLSLTVWEQAVRRMPIYECSLSDGAQARLSETAQGDTSAPLLDTGETNSGFRLKEPSQESKAAPPKLPSSVDAPYEFTQKTFETPLIVDAMDVLERLNALAMRWQTMKQGFCGELRQVEQAILDELHFVEFMELDMRRAYKSYKRLHELRIQRRILKNECVAIDAVCSSLGTNPATLQMDVQRAIKALEGLENRKYEPRITWPIEDDSVNSGND